MYQARNLQRISKEISELVQRGLLEAGLFYRIFYRCKEESSVEKKIESKLYDGKTRFLRDVIGIRINLYFVDDLQIVLDYLQKTFKDQFVEMTVDKQNETEFKPTRVNLIYRIPSDLIDEFKDVVRNDKIDSTFEIQLRTILSEGWHEVDHDLRYKCPEDWDDHSDLSRYFNGILASLEISDLSIINLFDQMSYRHYKGGNWKAMMRTKLRLRVSDSNHMPELDQLITASNEIQRGLYKIDRKEFIVEFLNQRGRLPLNLTNVVFFINHLFLKNPELSLLMPKEFLEMINQNNHAPLGNPVNGSRVASVMNADITKGH